MSYRYWIWKKKSICRGTTPHLVSNVFEPPIASPHPGFGGVRGRGPGLSLGKDHLRGHQGPLSTLQTLAIGELACDLGRVDIPRS
ncbi:hypothetical protein VTH06DRAFT_5407 [Thermothelomyces fergusii]